MQTMEAFIDESCPPYKSVVGNYKRYEIPLASLLLTAQSWRAMGNTKWADYYQNRAKAIRLRRHPKSKPKVEGFDWRTSLGLKKSKAEITPQVIISRETSVSASLMRY
jgi:hypothetical protein